MKGQQLVCAWRVSTGDEKCPTCGSVLEMLAETRDSTEVKLAERCPVCGYRQPFARVEHTATIERHPVPDSGPRSPLRPRCGLDAARDKFDMKRDGGWV